MHSYIAFLMYPQLRICSIEEVSKEALDFIAKNHANKRQIAKAAGFAIAYGGNGATIAKNCNIPKKDGEFVYNSYFQSFPVMKQYFDWVFNKASKKGYIEFNRVTKRKYFFNKDTTDYFLYKEYMEDRYNKYYDPEYGEKSRNFNKSKSDIQRMSQNYPIQGTSSDITKYGAILLFKEILNRGWWNIVKIVNIIHDELLIECPEEMAEEVSKLTIHCMEEGGKPFCQTVPLKASSKQGNYWVH